MHDCSYTDWIEYPHAQLRFVLETNRGTPTAFLVRVEGEWRPVVRFDHNPEGTDGHNMTEEGLHMDIYRDGGQVRTKRDFLPIELSRVPDYCVSYTENNADPLLKRYEQWHNLTTDR